jgi:GTP cyclohydrolase II
MDTVAANRHLGLPIDARTYDGAAAMLRDLGVTQVRLLTNNPAKVAGLAAAGITVAERVPLVMPPRPANARYLAAKRDLLGHWLADTPHDGERIGVNGGAHAAV